MTNLDLVRSIYEAWQRGDYRSVEWAHPEIEFVVPDSISPGKSTGLAEMAERWREFLGAWKDFHSEAQEFRELDGERVLVLARFSGRGRTSGVELGDMRKPGASLFFIRDGKVRKLVLYLDRERALADLGLTPDAPRSDEPV